MNKIKEIFSIIGVIVTGIFLFIIYQDKRQLDKIRLKLRKKELEETDNKIKNQEEITRKTKEDYVKKRADYLNKLDVYNKLTGSGRRKLPKDSE